MIIIPKKFAHNKHHVGVNCGLATSGNIPIIGRFGLKATERGDLNPRQLESARVTARKEIKKFGRAGRIVFRPVCDTIRSKKPIEVRMGSGKGPKETTVAKVKPGTIIFEIVGTTKEAAINACIRAGHKLPVKTLFVERFDVLWEER